jgi:hypothetical protein
MKRSYAVIASLLLGCVIGMFVVVSFVQPLGAEQRLFSGNEDHRISIEEAAHLTKAFRITASDDAVLAHYFGKKAIAQTLEQSGCVGIRLYYGKHNDGSPTLVVIGVDKRGNDMVTGITLQRTTPCPPDCSSNSVLKQDNTIATLQ